MAEFGNTNFDHIKLDNEELAILKNLATQITASPSEEPELFCRQSKDQSKNVPECIKNILINFAKYGSKNGFLYINTGLLCDFTELKTPSENNYKIGETTILSKIQSILIHTISEMIAYEAEGYGRLFQDIIPIQSMATKQTSVSSNIELEIHTEQAFSKLRPDILTLSCIRGDSNALTYILPVQFILDNLSQYEIELLRKPLWITGVDLSFKLNGNEFIDGDIRGPMSILNGDEAHPILIFDQDLMKGITEESNNMIKKIVDIYYKYRLKHNMQTGDIIFIDNRRAVHGRSPFSPKYDGYDRFLIRAFASYNYEYSNFARPNNGRTISAIYS
jgi:hypothetical protein